MIEGAEGIVESAYAAKSRYHGNLRHREPCIMNQLFSEEHASCLCDRHRRRAEVLFKEPAQLTFTHPHASGKGLDSPVLSIKKAFGDQRQGSGDGRRSAAPTG